MLTFIYKYTYTHIYIYSDTYYVCVCVCMCVRVCVYLRAFSEMFSDLGNGHGGSGSNPELGCLFFTVHLYQKESYEYNYFPGSYA